MIGRRGRVASRPRRFYDRSRASLGLVALCGAAVATGCGFAVGDAAGLESKIPFFLALLVLTLLAAGMTVRGLALCRHSVRSGQGVTALGSTTFGLVTLIAVCVSGYQLAIGARTSKLAELALPEVFPRADVTRDFIIFAIAAVGMWSGEWLSRQVRRPRRICRPSEVSPWAVYVVLLATSLIALLIGHSQSLSQTLNQRGQVQGQGPLQLLSNAPTVTVLVAMANRHWNDRRLVVLSAVLVGATLLEQGTRTPLAIVGVALLVRMIVSSARSRNPLGLISLLIAGAYVSLVLLVAISGWRGSFALGNQRVSLVSEIVQTAPDPISGLSAGGLDTVDGLTLATMVDRNRVGATVLDPLKAVITFIPRQIYPSKPDFLSGIVSRDYTDFGGLSGLFLSGPGYGLIVFGGQLPMMIMFIVIGFLVEALIQRQNGVTLWTMLACYFVARFIVGGDAFDLFNVLGLALIYGVSRVVASVLQREAQFGRARNA